MAITGTVNFSYYVPNPSGQGELSGNFQLVNPAAVGIATPVSLSTTPTSVTIPTNAAGGTPLFALIFPVNMIVSSVATVPNTEVIQAGGSTSATLHPTNPQVISLPATSPVLELSFNNSGAGATAVNVLIVWI